MATRRTIGTSLADTAARYEYKTQITIFAGVFIVKEMRRRVLTQTWEVQILNDGVRNTTPLISTERINAIGGTGWKVDEVTEQEASPFIVIHRETWTRKESWEEAD